MEPHIISLKEFKKKIKKLGYRTKTYTYGGRLRFLEVLDKDGNFIVGAGANVYLEETVRHHKEVFDLLRQYRGFVYDEVNEQKVSF